MAFFRLLNAATTRERPVSVSPSPKIHLWAGQIYCGGPVAQSLSPLQIRINPMNSNT
jgi:hypothetical protein